MRVVRTPDIARRIFTGNELYGWQPVCEYQYLPPKVRKRYKPKQKPQTLIPPVPVTVVGGGVEI